jgi:hypothetical protein
MSLFLPLCFFFGEAFTQIFLPFVGVRTVFFLLLSCESSLRVLDADSLSNQGFAKMFSHHLACLFIFLKLSFEKTDILNFNEDQSINF